MPVTCMCALDGDNGFCGSVAGTERYFKAMEAYRIVLEASQCHTLDRDDLRAQDDSCGIPIKDMWRTAVDLLF